MITRIAKVMTISLIVVIFLSRCVTTQSEYDAARKADTVSSYRTFLRQHPTGELSIAARNRIDEIDFNTAKRKGTEQSYRYYLSQHPEGLYRQEAQAILRSQEFRKLIRGTDIPSMTAFVARYPDTTETTEIVNRKKRLDAIMDQLKANKQTQKIKAGMTFHEAFKIIGNLSPDQSNMGVSMTIGGPTQVTAVNDYYLVSDAELVGVFQIHATLNPQYRLPEKVIQTSMKVISLDGSPDQLLLLAAKNGNVEQVKVWLGKGANIHCVDVMRRTSLMLAAGNGNEAIVKELLARKARLEDKDVHSTTALILAAEDGRTSVVKLLIEAGANINVHQDSAVGWGWTALMRAADSGYTDTVKVLLNAGADVNAKQNGGLTTLDLVVSKGHAEIAAMLLASGSKVTAKTRERAKTPKMVRLLQGTSQ